MSTAQTTICGAPSCIPTHRPGAALASKSLCTPVAGETSRRTQPKRWWRRPWPWFPPRISRPVCSPTARQAVGELGCVPRPVPRPSRPTAGLHIRSLVRAHDNRPGLGSQGPANQGTRRQRGNMGEGRRMGRGWDRSDAIPRMPMQAQSWQLANDLHNCIQTVQTPEPSCRPLPRFRGFKGPTRARRLAELDLPSPRGAQNSTGPRNLHALNQEPRKTPPTYPRLGECRRLAAT